MDNAEGELYKPLSLSDDVCIVFDASKRDFVNDLGESDESANNKLDASVHAFSVYMGHLLEQDDADALRQCGVDVLFLATAWPFRDVHMTEVHQPVPECLPAHVFEMAHRFAHKPLIDRRVPKILSKTFVNKHFNKQWLQRLQQVELVLPQYRSESKRKIPNADQVLTAKWQARLPELLEKRANAYGETLGVVGTLLISIAVVLMTEASNRRDEAENKNVASAAIFFSACVVAMNVYGVSILVYQQHHLLCTLSATMSAERVRHAKSTWGQLHGQRTDAVRAISCSLPLTLVAAALYTFTDKEIVCGWDSATCIILVLTCIASGRQLWRVTDKFSPKEMKHKSYTTSSHAGTTRAITTSRNNASGIDQRLKPRTGLGPDEKTAPEKKDLILVSII